MKATEFSQLLQNCQKQHADSQKQLYRQFYNYGMTICSRYARDREEAKEIFNDAFFKVFTKLDMYTPGQSFKAWLNRIIVNTAIDHYRKNQSQIPTVDLVHAQYMETPSTILENLSAKEILALVQHLPPSYRLVFNLHVVEGYSHPEIAQKLDISVGASKSNLAKARSKLKALLYKVHQKSNRYG